MCSGRNSRVTCNGSRWRGSLRTLIKLPDLQENTKLSYNCGAGWNAEIHILCTRQSRKTRHLEHPNTTKSFSSTTTNTRILHAPALPRPQASIHSIRPRFVGPVPWRTLAPSRSSASSIRTTSRILQLHGVQQNPILAVLSSNPHFGFESRMPSYQMRRTCGLIRETSLQKAEVVARRRDTCIPFPRWDVAWSFISTTFEINNGLSQL